MSSRLPETLSPADFEAVLSELVEAVTIIDRDGRMVYVNAAAAELIGGGTAAELMGRSAREITAEFVVTDEVGRPLPDEELPGRRVMRGEHADPVIIRYRPRDGGGVKYSRLRAQAILDEQGQPRYAVSVFEDVTATLALERTDRLLARASELLEASLDYGRMLQEVARLAVPDLADWCCVDLPGPRGEPTMLALAHVDPAKVRLGMRLRREYPPEADSSVAEVMRGAPSFVVDQLADADLVAAAQDDEHLGLLRGIGMNAVLVVPLRAATRPVGALTLVQAESGRRFAPEDVALAEELGRRLGSAVQTARVLRERSQIAHTLQTSLLPSRVPDLPGWELAVMYRPAGEENEVGGDFYDAFTLPDGWLAVVGDMAGKGAHAAALTSLARHTLRTAKRMGATLPAALAELNAELRYEAPGELCTLLVARCAAADQSVRFVSAGHPPPILLRDGRAAEVEVGGPVLGAHRDVAHAPTRLETRSGDCLVLYTDGIPDTIGAAGRFGTERLIELLAGSPSEPAAVIAEVERRLSSFAKGPQPDDIALLVLRRR